jgi:predicted dienelactone hydrolase
MPKRPLVLSLPILLACAVLPATSAAAPRTCRDAAPRTTAGFAAPGPYPVGQRTVTYVDPSRATRPNGSFPGAPDRTLVTEIWYPAASAGRDTALDATGAPYPVVIHSHGFLDSRLGEAYLAAHWAGHGYVVAAIDYPLTRGGAPGGANPADVVEQPADWSFVLDRLLADLGGAVDPERVGASGLSLGGLTTYLVTYHEALRDPRIRAAATLAGLSCLFERSFYDTADVPLLIVYGDSDQLLPYSRNGRRAFADANEPKFLVRLRQGSHTGFSGFATLFDPAIHYDAIGCAAIGGTDLPDAEVEDPFAGLGGPGTGVDLDPRRCPRPCQRRVPSRPSMSAGRHHELTRVSTLAFFDAYLRGDDDARCFLDRPFSRENRDARARSRARTPVAP